MLTADRQRTKDDHNNSPWALHAKRWAKKRINFKIKLSSPDHKVEVLQPWCVSATQKQSYDQYMQSVKDKEMILSVSKKTVGKREFAYIKILFAR